ncbi:hypothetical protein SELMODRAFT_430510 [Selaginella moellendorffii]|uniref:Uncharacterized protein n=1 Tax=Selaginella moellendorffii TaxID=88036 RepID=D8T9M7_SELML|nr:hypothetical protein SELMODRAFT_430510 [Selaginella moellendorffii]
MRETQARKDGHSNRVIEAVGIGAPEATTTDSRVLTFDVGGGGGVVPSVVEAGRSKVDEPAEERLLGGCSAPTAPRASGARGASGGEGLCMHDSDTILNDRVRDTIIQTQEWTVRSAYDLNMAIYSSFVEVGFGSTTGTFIVSATFLGTGRTESVTTELEEKWDLIWLRKSLTLVEPMTREYTMKLNMACHKINMLNQFVFQAYTLVHDIEHLRFIGMLSLEKVQTFCCLGKGTDKAPEELIYNISKSKMSFAEQSVCLELLNTWLQNNEKRCEIRMEKVMKEKAYIFQSIADGEEILQVWDEKFLSSTRTCITLEEYIRVCLAELGNGWLPCGGTSSVEFKNQPRQPFLARYLKYCPSAPVYTVGVLQKLLTRGKKLGMYEPEFYCPCIHERELCPWYLELVEQMPTSNFELDLYLECHLEALSNYDNDVIEVQQLNTRVQTQETI